MNISIFKNEHKPKKYDEQKSKIKEDFNNEQKQRMFDSLLMVILKSLETNNKTQLLSELQSLNEFIYNSNSIKITTLFNESNFSNILLSLSFGDDYVITSEALKCINQFIIIENEFFCIFIEKDIIKLLINKLKEKNYKNKNLIFDCLISISNKGENFVLEIFSLITLDEIIKIGFNDSSERELNRFIYEITVFELPKEIVQRCFYYFIECFNKKYEDDYKLNYWSIKQIVEKKNFSISNFDLTGLNLFIEEGIGSLDVEYITPSIIIIGILYRSNNPLPIFDLNCIFDCIYDNENNIFAQTETILSNAILTISYMLKNHQIQYEFLMKMGLPVKLMNLIDISFNFKKVVFYFFTQFLKCCEIDSLCFLVENHLLKFLSGFLDLETNFQCKILFLFIDIVSKLEINHLDLLFKCLNEIDISIISETNDSCVCSLKERLNDEIFKINSSFENYGLHT